MLIHRPRSWKVKVWQPEQVIITGAYWGWFGVLFPLVIIVVTHWFMFFFFEWGIPLVVAFAVVGLSAQFKLIIQRSVMVLHGSFLGYTFVQDVMSMDAAQVELGFDWDSTAPPGVEIGSHMIGDEINAIPLFHTIRAAMAHVRGQTETTSAHLGLIAPVTAAPTQTPVDVNTARTIIERYQRQGFEVLLARGWKSDDAERISLYVVTESLPLVFDAYILTNQIAALEELRPTPAKNDEMAMTTYRRFVWTKAPFRLWQKGTLIARLHTDSFWTEKGGEVPKSDILSVRGWLSKNWQKMGVELEIIGAKKTSVVHGLNLGQGSSFFYDGIDLMFDVEWVESIARTLAKDLNVACIEDNLTGESSLQ